MGSPIVFDPLFSRSMETPNLVLMIAPVPLVSDLSTRLKESPNLVSYLFSRWKETPVANLVFSRWRGNCLLL